MSQDKTLANLQTALSMELTAFISTNCMQAFWTTGEWGCWRARCERRCKKNGTLREFLARILFLKGDPKLALQKTPSRARSLKEMFQADLNDEKEAINFYIDASLQAATEKDLGSRRLFESIAIEEESHMSWLELQLDLLGADGEAAFIAKYMNDGSDNLTS